MSVETPLSRVQYDTNGTNGPWSIPFYFLADADIRAVYADAAGVETDLVLTTDYTLTGAADPAGGTLTTVTAYASGGTVTILRDVDALQPVEFQDGDPFPASTTNRSLDRLTMLAQQLKENIGRALVLPASDAANPELPIVSARAGRFAAFDSSGAVTVSSLTETQIGEYIASLSSTTVNGGYINVKADPYAATADGTTDDTAAVQAAIDAAEAIDYLSIGANAGGRPAIYFPAGVYKVGTLTSNKRLRFVGDGSGSTFIILKAGVTTSLFVCNAEDIGGGVSTEDFGHHIFQGMTLQGNRTDSYPVGSSHGIYCPDTSWGIGTQYSAGVWMDDVQIVGFDGCGLYTGSNRNLSILSKVAIRYCNDAGWKNYGYDTRAWGCDFGANTLFQVRLAAGGGNKFSGCNFYYSNPAADAVGAGDGINVVIDSFVNSYVEFDGCDNDLAWLQSLYNTSTSCDVAWKGGRFYDGSRASNNGYAAITTFGPLKVMGTTFIKGTNTFKYLVDIGGAPAVSFASNQWSTSSAPYGTAISNKPAMLASSDELTLNVMRYGATGDGTTDDTAALQAAFNAAAGTGRTVYLPYASYKVTSSLNVHKCRVKGDNASLVFSGLGAGVDCLVLQGSSSAFPLEIEGIVVNANSTGRDAVVMAGGKSGDTSCDFLKIRSMLIQGAVRDAIHMEPSLATNWIEDFHLYDVRIAAPGRHGIAMIVPNLATTFINQGTFNNVEIRGAGQATAGSYDVYVDTQGTAADQKVSEITWIGCEFDVANAANHAQGSISFNRTGSAGSIDCMTFIGHTFEDVGTVITGFPYVVNIGASVTVNGIFMLGGIITKYLTLVDPAKVSRVFVRQASSNRDQTTFDLGSLGFAASYANDAAAAAAGVAVGHPYRNGSNVCVRVV